MIGRLLQACSAILGAAAFAQFPEFYQQYLQRLGGRLDQARFDLDRLIEDAATLGRTVEAYIQELFAAGGEAAQLAAKRELARLDGARELEQAYQALSQAGPLERPVAFLHHFDPSLAEATLGSYAPGFPVTPEGFAYAAAGLLAGLLIAVSGAGAGRRAVKMLRKSQRHADRERQA